MPQQADVENVVRDDQPLVDESARVYGHLTVPLGERPWWKPTREQIAWWVFKMLSSILTCFVVLIIVYRWMMHGLRTAASSIAAAAADLYSLLDYLSPSETDARRDEKVEEVIGIFRQKYQDVFGQASFFFFRGMTFFDWIISAIGVAAMILGSYYVLRFFGLRGRRVIQRIRGIRLESVREGSVFRRAEIPSFQVAVASAGLLSDEHHGYGVRCNEYLVTPTHVLEKDGEMMTQALLIGPKGKVLTSLNVVKSKMVDDLSYVYLDQKTWSLLGTSKAKVSENTVHCFATCTGEPGQSTGRMTKTNLRWMMSYTGSTLPGMSGAAYVDSGLVVGFHHGASGMFNIGISSELIVWELRKICINEATPDTNVDMKKPVYMGSDNKRFWDGVEALKSLDNVYNSDWVNPGAIDYNQKLNFDDETAVRVQLPSGGVRISKQNKTGSEVAYLPASCLAFVEELQKQNILERLTKVETLVDKPIPAAKGSFKCNSCEIVCRTENRLSNHKKNSHVEKLESVKESAVPSDFKKVVKTGSFLGTRSSSPPNKLKNLKRSSNMSVKSQRFQPQGESLSGLLDSQRNIENLLSALLQRMGGQSLDTTQKCVVSSTTQC